QLALQPHLQILRRSRRPLLCGMEQARRSALAHHVHRTAPMGPRVLINGIWYQMPQGGHPPHHSITSSARAISVGGTSRPSALAFRLITDSNLPWMGYWPFHEAVRVRPAVVASPQDSTCLHQEITLQTYPLTLQTCPSSIGCFLAERAIRLAIHVQSSLLVS